MIYHQMDERTRRNILDSLKLDISERKNIVFAYLFGSFNDYDERVGFRDIDIAAYFSTAEETLSASISLSYTLSNKYSLCIDCMPMNDLPLYLRYRIFSKGVVIFCRNKDLKDILVEETITEALDFLPLRKQAIRELV